MAETYITVRSDGIQLEGFMERAESNAAAAILCHPHPLYGGNMQNGIVLCLQKVLRKWGWSTIRFNFRGVGRSHGSYADGRGEAEDLLAVAEYLSRQGISTIHPVGYSFGAWVALKSMEVGLQAASLILVSPPIDFLDFSNLQIPPVPCLITAGDRDDFCNLSSLKPWAAANALNASLATIEELPGCDHFYWGHESALSAKVLQFLKKHFTADVG
jgi:uncharacterized protein